MKTTTFASIGIVTQYFSHYLPKQRGLSPNTIKSYRDTMIQLLCFMDKELNISINKIESKIFDTELINTFLDYLATERNISISSRNQRLAALHSFFKFLMLHDLECFDACSSILNIEYTRKPYTVMNYLSIEEVKTLLRIPDPKTTKGLRELCILATLYETAARVQELIDIKLSDMTFELPPVILLHGKGNKERLIPISNDVVAIISKYCKVYNISSNDNLFQNIQGNELTRNGVRYIVNKNIRLAKSIHPELFNGKITKSHISSQ